MKARLAKKIIKASATYGFYCRWEAFPQQFGS